MGVLVWSVGAYALGALPLPVLLDRRRIPSWPLALAVGAVPVLLASRSAGGDEAAAAAIGVVTGHYWPMLRTRGAGLWCPVGALLPVLPFETCTALLAAGLVFAAGRRRVWPALGLVAVPVVALLRGQPAPLVVAGIAVLLLIAARRMEGAGSPLRAVRRVLAAGPPA